MGNIYQFQLQHEDFCACSEEMVLEKPTERAKMLDGILNEMREIIMPWEYWLMRHDPKTFESFCHHEGINLDCIIALMKVLEQIRDHTIPMVSSNLAKKMSKRLTNDLAELIKLRDKYQVLSES